LFRRLGRLGPTAEKRSPLVVLNLQLPKVWRERFVYAHRQGRNALIENRSYGWKFDKLDCIGSSDGRKLTAEGFKLEEPVNLGGRGRQ